MSVTLKLQQPPINSLMFGAVLFAGLTWWLWPTQDSYWQTDAIAWMCAGLTLMLVHRGVGGLADNYRLRRNLAVSEEVSEDFGSARQATWAEGTAAQMDDPESSNFLGLFEGTAPVFAPPGTPFSLIEMPPGTGKTVNYVMGSILHHAELGYSIVVADPKLELGVMLGPQLRARGHEVWFANPTKSFEKLCGDVELNPYQGLLDAAHAPDERRKDAPKVAADYAVQHYPVSSDEKNPYFGHGSRRTLTAVGLILAVTDPAHCTPTDVFRTIADPRRLKKLLRHARDVLEGISKGDPLVDFVKGEAANLLSLAETNEENFGSFLEGGTQRLLPFSQAGRLGGYGRNAVRNIAELRERPIILFSMTPLSHMREMSAFTSFLTHNVIAACKNNPTGRPVHIVGEEALNYTFTDLVSDMETLRGLGCSADLYIQSYAGLERKFGRDGARAIESYSDVKVYAGLSSFDRAKFVSDMLAEETIRRQDYSYDTVVKSMGVNSREMSRRLMTPNEILAMPRDRAWVFVRGMNPMLLQMANYGEIAPWRDWVDANPLEGEPLRAAPRFSIHYPEDAAHG